MRIVFMGSPRFAVPSLEQLLLNDFKVVAAYTQPDRPSGRGRRLAVSPVKEAAIKWRIPVMQPPSLKSAEALAELAALKPDIIIICAFGQILPQALLDIPPYQCLNGHFSLLPRHRGASPVAAAILDGDEFAGVSIQLVRKKLDTGPVLAAAAVPISPADNTGTLTDKLSIVGAHLLQEALTGWLRGSLTPLPQDESKASYFGQVNKEDGEIDWKLPAVDIWRRVRAYYPWPGGFTYWQGKQLKINEAIVIASAEKSEPGCVIALPDVAGGVGITSGDGILGVLNVQYAGKKAMSAADFLRGQRDFLGTKLPS
ncbi:MAG: methionyl-tRNA formyltransferase [Chloroflexi bacterium RBG_16_50_11]|nr:MAG: methionyl-tRNA formyltransferase [Chloroflexi bacterium RBG_16_50_11]